MMNIIPPYSYVNVVRHVIQKDGVMGLFGRGLKTRLIANGMQVWSRIQFFFGLIPIRLGEIPKIIHGRS